MCTPFVDQQFGHVRFTAKPCGNLRESVLSFYGAITTQFCFTYTLEGVTAMPRGLHVIIITIIVIIEIIMVKLASGCQPILVPLRRISKKAS